VDEHLRNLIRVDYERLLNRERLNTSAEIEKLILIQSIEGHAHNGHGAFRQLRYVDVMTSDVVLALGLDPVIIKGKRQKLVDDVVRWVELALLGNQPDTLINGDGKPLLGIPQFAGIKTDGIGLLKGFFIGGFRDRPDIRRSVEEKYGVSIGGGNCYLVDTTVMGRMGLDGEILAHEPHEEEIERFRSEGLIVDLPESEVDDGRIRYMYIRHRGGNGHSDDAAVVSAGVLYGRDVALGVFLADAIDTLDKYALYYRDQDFGLAERLKSSPVFDETWNEALEMVTYLATIPDDNDDVADSSLRYFLLIDKETERCALLSHLDFIEGRPTVPLLLGHNRVKNTLFYKYMREKLTEYAARVSEPVKFKTPAASVASAISRNFVKVLETEPLYSVVDALLEKGADLAIIVDNSGKIRGTLDAHDLLRMIWSGREDDKS
jgi:CBS domain-containing protein